MSLTKKQATQAVKNADKVCAGFSVPIYAKNLGAFEKQLELMAPRYGKVGQELDPEDLAMIGEQVQDLLRDMGSLVEMQTSKGTRQPVEKPTQFTMAAVDYLYALCMDKLGCPHIPVGFNKDVQNVTFEVAKQVRDTRVKFDMSKTRSFRAQRRKDVKELLTGEVGVILKEAQGEKPTSTQIGRLVAEYQALCERQRRHTWIWRFFHSDENDARTELINVMRTTLQARLDPSVDFDKTRPAVIAKNIADGNIKRNIDKAMSLRYVDMASVYGVNDGAISSENDDFTRINMGKENGYHLLDDLDGRNHEAVISDRFEPMIHSEENVIAKDDDFNLVK